MYLVEARVRRRAKEAGKRVSKEFLVYFERFIERKLEEAIQTPNGGKKTLDMAVAGYVLGTLR
jgi:hypothetical protein